MAKKPKGIKATGRIRNGLPQLNYYNKIIINRIIHAKINVSGIVNLNLVNANSVPILSFFFSFPFFHFFSFLCFWPARTQVQNWRINKRFSGQARVDSNSCCKCGWICLHSFYGKTLQIGIKTIRKKILGDLDHWNATLILTFKFHQNSGFYHLITVYSMYCYFGIQAIERAFSKLLCIKAWHFRILWLLQFNDALFMNWGLIY